MGALKFNGTSGKVTANVAGALATLPGGAYTLAWVMKRNTATGFDALTYLDSAGPVAEIGGSLGPFGGPQDLGIDNGGNARTDSQNLNSTASPYMFVLQKTAGTTIPNLNWKLGSGGAWTSVAMNNTDPNQSNATTIEFGVLNGSSDWLDGWLGVFAAWSGVMNDTQAQTLDDNWRTSDLYNFSGSGISLVCLVEFNVAGASLTDLAGNATSFSATGTSLDAAETLNSWNFDGTGGGGGGGTTSELAGAYSRTFVSRMRRF